LQAVGIADSEHFLADFQLFGIAHRYGYEALFSSIDLQYGQVVIRVEPNHFRWVFGFVGERDLQPDGTFNDVVVRNNVARIVDDDP
jgi:hypothetical protein